MSRDKKACRERVEKEPDFVVSSKHRNSLSKVLSEHKGEMSNFTIARLLAMEDEAEVEAEYLKAVDILRRALTVKNK